MSNALSSGPLYERCQILAEGKDVVHLHARGILVSGAADTFCG